MQEQNKKWVVNFVKNYFRYSNSIVCMLSEITCLLTTSSSVYVGDILQITSKFQYHPNIHAESLLWYLKSSRLHAEKSHWNLDTGLTELISEISGGFLQCASNGFLLIYPISGSRFQII